MPGRSRYDELYDFYQAISTKKSGTRYERLAAIVFAALDQSSVVIHDLEVVGLITGSEHQIDVTIEKDGKTKRILIECKDFDVSGDPVGLGIVRDFYGVVADAQPDESWIITCNYFTTEARKYAKGMGIKLATLREFADSDWQNRIHTIGMKLTVVGVGSAPSPNFKFTMNDADLASLSNDLKQLFSSGRIEHDSDVTQLFDGNTIRSFSKIATELASKMLSTDESHVVESATVSGWVSGNGVDRYNFSDYTVSLPISRVTQTMTLSSVRDGAKLLLTDGDGLDFILWDTTLKAFTIEGDGSVTLSPDAVQKRLITTVSAPVSH
jgi:hypothetical protein